MGLLDDVMGGIAAKDKGQAQQTATQEHVTPQEQTNKDQQPSGANSLHTYSDDFQKKYGDKK